MSFRQQWDLVAAVLVLALGALLVVLAHPAEGRDLLALGSGLVTGIVWGRRRASSGASIPPGVSLLAIGALAASVSGCGGGSDTSRCRTMHAVARAGCAALEQVEETACSGGPVDAGTPP